MSAESSCVYNAVVTRIFSASYCNRSGQQANYLKLPMFFFVFFFFNNPTLGSHWSITVLNCTHKPALYYKAVRKLCLEACLCCLKYCQQFSSFCLFYCVK